MCLHVLQSSQYVYARRMKRFRLGRALSFLVVSLTTTTAFAGGYDTPMLYTARHMGMGGAAQAYVDDPSALFHNPAGLMGTDRLSIVADFSLLTGSITSSPNNNTEARSIESERTIAPFFLLGVSGRITEWLTAGFSVYPVASAGAEFQYDDGFGATTTDRTRLVFLELSPGVAFQIPSYPELSIGLGYRITIVQLERFQQTVDSAFPDAPDTGIDFELSGASFGGFRLGVQWRALKYLQVGVSYRHKTETTVDGDGIVVGSDWDYVSTKFTLPSRLALGLRSDFADFGVALDIEYALNSQNDHAFILVGPDRAAANACRETDMEPDNDDCLDNVSDWTDAITIRAGLEYRLLEGQLPIRVGYIWDQTTSSSSYPSAFGTPPGPTHVITLGTGWNTPTWSIDVAYAFRQGSATMTADDFAARGDRECPFCSYPTDPGADGIHGTNDDGDDYAIRLHGLYLTVSYNLGVKAEDEEPAVPDYPTSDESQRETYEPEPVELEEAEEPVELEPEEQELEDRALEEEHMSEENVNEDTLPMNEDASDL